MERDSEDDNEFTDLELADLDENETAGAGFGVASSGSGPADAPAAGPTEDAATAATAATGVERASVEAQLGDARARARELQQFSTDLAQLDDAELHEHVAYYQHAHSELQRALGDLDNA